MTEFEVLYITNIVAMIILAGTLSYLMGRMKYKFWFCIARWIFQKDRSYLNWLLNRSEYIAFAIIIPALLLSALILTSQLNYGLPKIRIVWSTVLSIIIWGAEIWALLKIMTKDDN